MNLYTVELTLYVKDDDADGALAAAQSLLKDAGGSDTADDEAPFCFAIGTVRALR